MDIVALPHRDDYIAMYKINVVCVGKLKEEYLREACAEYLKRLSRFSSVKVVELAEGKNPAAEAGAIARACKGKVIALCVEGEKFSSEGFASLVRSYFDVGEELTFVIGSSCGLDKSIKEGAARRISFSDMTFPHQLMRVILLEQLYRAFMICGGGEYHK